MELDNVAPKTEEIAALALRIAVQRGRKPATLENKRNCWEAKIVPAFAGRQAALVSFEQAQQAADGWASEYGPHAALKAAREAGHGWRLAMQRGWIKRTPWNGVYIPGAKRGQQRWMPADARRRLRDYLEPIALRARNSRFHRVTALTLLMLAEVPTGRMAETAALEWAGIDESRAIVTWYRHKTDGRSGPKQSALSKYALEVLAVARSVSGHSRWVFPSPVTGQPFVDLTKSMARVCAHVGLPRYTPHDLRRGIAQEALDAGASIEDISAMLGHESVRTTEAYLQWSPTRARRALSLVTLGGRGG